MVNIKKNFSLNFKMELNKYFKEQKLAYAIRMTGSIIRENQQAEKHKKHTINIKTLKK